MSSSQSFHSEVIHNPSANMLLVKESPMTACNFKEEEGTILPYAQEKNRQHALSNNNDYQCFLKLSNFISEYLQQLCSGHSQKKIVDLYQFLQHNSSRTVRLHRQTNLSIGGRGSGLLYIGLLIFYFVNHLSSPSFYKRKFRNCKIVRTHKMQEAYNLKLKVSSSDTSSFMNNT